ncbi:hypothetical protein Tco_1237000 [Tanacetum coccineum]
MVYPSLIYTAYPLPNTAYLSLDQKDKFFYVLIPFNFVDMALPPRDHRHQYLSFKGLEYTNEDIADFKERLGKIYGREIHQVQVLDFGGLTDLMAEGLCGSRPVGTRAYLEFFSTFRFGKVVLDLDTVGALHFQLGGARRRISWREFILGMGLHTAEEIDSSGFGAYWAENARHIPDKGDLSAY